MTVHPRFDHYQYAVYPTQWADPEKILEWILELLLEFEIFVTPVVGVISVQIVYIMINSELSSAGDCETEKLWWHEIQSVPNREISKRTLQKAFCGAVLGLGI